MSGRDGKGYVFCWFVEIGVDPGVPVRYCSILASSEVVFSGDNFGVRSRGQIVGRSGPGFLRHGTQVSQATRVCRCVEFQTCTRKVQNRPYTTWVFLAYRATVAVQKNKDAPAPLLAQRRQSAYAPYLTPIDGSGPATFDGPWVGWARNRWPSART